MKEHISTIWNAAYYNEPVQSFYHLPTSLQVLVKDWEFSYSALNGDTKECSRQIAALLFQMWEVRDEYASFD
tara:strand:+ start:1283 stop:1498 length:216 start_codon:yes stop_codon:yes gene_type:complete